MNEPTVICKDCKRAFILAEETEYIMSYCPGCDRMIVLYKINPAILAKDKDKPAVFISSGPSGSCRKCGQMMTVRNNKDYVSIRCVNDGFGIIYKMFTHRGVARFIGSDTFDKTHYWFSGKRAHDRKLKEEEMKR